MTTFAYDNLGRVTTTTQQGSDGPGSNDLTSSTQYDALGRRIAETDPLGRTTRFDYDDAGRLTAVSLPTLVDDGPNPADGLTSTGSTAGIATYTYAYDAYGNRTAITDPKGNTTAFAFDAQNRQTSRTLPLGVESTGIPNDFTESMTYIASGIHFGRLHTTTDFEGNTVTHTYDAYGRQSLAVYTDDAGTEQRRVTTKYDALGRVHQILDAGNQGLGTTTHTYDDEGRLITRATPQGTIHYEYDDLGRMEAAFTASTRTEYGYDQLNRLTSTKLTERFGVALTELTQYAYDAAGMLDHEAGPNGIIKDHDYDTLGRLDKITHFTETDGNFTFNAGTDTLVAQFTYTYDAAGNRLTALETFSDGATTQSQQFTWTYDALNRLVTEHFDAGNNGQSPSDYIHSFAFDLASNRTEQTIDSGADGYTGSGGDETTNYTHDANDRLTTETSTSGTTTTYTYDDRGNRLTKTVAGTNPETHTYTFDATNRMIQAVVTQAGTTTTTDYLYNDQGLRVEQTVDDGTTSTTTVYHRDARNPTGYSQVLEEKDSLGNVLQSFTLGLDVIAQATATEALAFVYDAHGSTRALTTSAGTIKNDTSGGGLQVFTYNAYGELAFMGGTLLGVTDAANALTHLLYSGEWRLKSTGLDDLRARPYDFAVGQFLGRDPIYGDVNNPLSLHKHLYTHANPIQYVDPSGTRIGLVTVGAITAGVLVGLTTYCFTGNKTFAVSVGVASAIPFFWAGYAAVTGGRYVGAALAFAILGYGAGPRFYSLTASHTIAPINYNAAARQYFTLYGGAFGATLPSAGHIVFRGGVRSTGFPTTPPIGHSSLVLRAGDEVMTYNYVRAGVAVVSEIWITVARVNSSGSLIALYANRFVSTSSSWVSIISFSATFTPPVLYYEMP